MDRPYATPSGVRAYLSSLEGLHALRIDRAAAAERRELLPAFCVHGRHVLASDGRFGALTGISAAPISGLPDVVPLEELDRRGRRIHGDRWRLSYLTPAPLAPYDRLCPECGNGWTYAERSDVVETRERRVVLHGEEAAAFIVVRHAHVACHEAACARDALWWAEDVLERAGDHDASPEPCPASPNGHGPWFRCRTDSGAFRFGRRGPGFGIDWSETGKDLGGRFCRVVAVTPLGPVWNEPPVEHGPFHVDPKDESWLILYLRRLRRALEA